MVPHERPQSRVSRSRATARRSGAAPKEIDSRFTFNAAGLHDNTIQGLGMTPDDARDLAEGSLVRNYVVDGEGLTCFQEGSLLAPSAPDPVGHKVELADPHSFWEHLNPLNVWEPSHHVRLHLMDAVLDAMRQDRPWESQASAA